jgi:rsbT co-antagonist protein RsbR
MNDILGRLKPHKKRLLVLWTELLISHGAADGVAEQQESKEFASAALDVFCNFSISSSLDVFETLHDLVTGITSSRINRGHTSRENVQYLLLFKEAASQILSEIEPNAANLYQANLQLGSIIDNMAIITFESFVKSREDVIARQINEISEISTPVIRVWEGVIALPIIGTLDSSRTQEVMENLLQQIVATGSSIAILDISGLPVVDSLVAEHLIKTVSLTRLMGAECIISGIRPEIAQTVVHLGIDLTGIITKVSLASALQTAFEILQLAVVPKNTMGKI